MKQINRQAIVPFSCQQMFELVDDIEAYPEFLPFCSGATLISRDDNALVASLKVSKSSFEQSFTTKNTNKPYQSIAMELVDGPFKSLNGLWSFTHLSDTAAKIELDIEFEFSNKFMDLAFGKAFSQLAESFVDAFTGCHYRAGDYPFGHFRALS